MAQLSRILRSIGAGRVAFRCPGCNEAHQVNVDPNRQGPLWGYNGDPERPTFTPSILVTWKEPSDVDGEFNDETKDKQHVCHSFVTDGRIQFLGDCTHALAGQTVNLPSFFEG